MASLWQDVRNVVGTGVATLGHYGLGGGLPELGISEAITGNPMQTTPLGQQPTGATPGYKNPGSDSQNIFPSSGKVQGVTTGPTLNPGGSPSASSLVGGGGVGTGGSLAEIDAAYQQSMNDLTAQRGQTNAQYDIYGNQLQNQYAQTSGDIGAQQTATNAQIEASKEQVNQSSQSAVQNARQAYNELQQRNQAYLSAQGISSSSAAEAMQEGLSKNTLQALNNITQNKDQTLQNIATQEASVKDFYDRQTAYLLAAKQTAQDQLKLQLTTALNQIDSQQGMATLQKQQAKNAVFSQAAAAAQQTNASIAQMQGNLDTYNNVTNQVLSNVKGYAGGTVTTNDFLNAIATTNAQLRSSGLQIDPATLANSVSNPYARATTGSYYTSNQVTIGADGKKYDQYGNVIQ